MLGGTWVRREAPRGCTATDWFYGTRKRIITRVRTARGGGGEFLEFRALLPHPTRSVPGIYLMDNLCSVWCYIQQLLEVLSTVKTCSLLYNMEFQVRRWTHGLHQIYIDADHEIQASFWSLSFKNFNAEGFSIHIWM